MHNGFNVSINSILLTNFKNINANNTEYSIKLKLFDLILNIKKNKSLLLTPFDKQKETKYYLKNILSK